MIEIRTDKRLGWLFILLSGPVLVGVWIASFYEGNLPLLVITCVWTVFVPAFCIGIHLVRNPRLLIRLDDLKLQLFTGSLWQNAAMVSIPCHWITSLKIEEAAPNDGTMCYIVVETSEPVVLTKKAQRWAAATRHCSMRSDAPATFLMWSLWHVNDPVEALTSRLKDHLQTIRTAA